MGRFHACHVIPAGMRILHGYDDVIKTVLWGLRELGHEVSYSINVFEEKARNIVFGAASVRPEILAALPENSILYNLEQVSGLGPYVETFPDLCRRFEIWDYSRRNIEDWKRIDPEARVRFVPIGYTPALVFPSRPPAEQDIDVLFYGDPGPRRLEVFEQMCRIGLTALYCYGLFDKARDELIARSKMILNIHQPDATTFSIVRVSHLLANSKVVLTDIPDGMEVEEDIAGAILAYPAEHCANIAWQVARDEPRRLHLGAKGHAVMTQRDIRTILGTVLPD